MTASQQGGGIGRGNLAAAAAARANLLRDSVQNRAAALVAQRWTTRKCIDAHSDGGASPTDEQHLQARQQQRRHDDDVYSSDDCDADDRSSQRQPRRSRKKARRGLDYSRWARRAESRVFLPIMSGSASSSVDDLRPIGATAGSEVGRRSRGGSADDGQSPPTAAAIVDAPAGGGKKRTSDAAAEVATASAESAASASGAPQPPAPPLTLDNDEELGEEERVELAIKAVKRLEGGLLREIHEIKERHKTLEALTVTRARAAKNEAGAASAVATPATAATAKRSAAAPPSRHRTEPPSLPPPQRKQQQRLLQMTPRPASSRRGQQQPHSGSEANGGLVQPVDGSPSPATTAEAPYPEKATFLRAPGVAWKIRSLSPSGSGAGGGRQLPRGGAARTRAVPPPMLLPPASARLGKRQLRQWSDLDLGSAYFLPPSVSEAKTPIEAALRLQKVLTDLSLLNSARNASQRAARVAAGCRI